MKKLKVLFPTLVILLFCLSGCSSNSKNESGKMNESKASIDSAQTGNSVGNLGDTELKKETRGNSKDIAKATNQMVIYQADLRIRVKKFEQTLQILEGKVEKYGGYIAESNVIKEGKEHEREY